LEESTPAQRAQLVHNGLDAMAEVHATDWRGLGLDFLDKRQYGAIGIEQQVNYYEQYLDWAAEGRPQPVATAALEWVRANIPEEPEIGLCWGDARINNQIFDDQYRVAAVLDWEMVTLGSPEADLAWAIFLDRHHSEGLDSPRLAGFPSYEQTLTRYESLTGHRVKHLHYYQVFAGFRFAVIFLRIAQQLVHYELMDAAAGRRFELDNTVSRLLAKDLGLPAPDATA
jgi:aminoglycoside phosphotransferase (APT) family kinase protein